MDPPKTPYFDPLDYAPPLRSFPGAGVSQGGYPGGLGGDLGGGGGYRGGYPKIPHFLGVGGRGVYLPHYPGEGGSFPGIPKYPISWGEGGRGV